MNVEPGEHGTSASGSYNREGPIVGSGEIGDAFHVNSDETIEAYAKALQDAEDHEMTAQMMVLAGMNDCEGAGFREETDLQTYG